jgi:hypothetical protein
MSNTYYSISPLGFNPTWKHGYGFFSNYRICLDQLIDYHKNYDKCITPYINWEKTTWVENFNPVIDEICYSSENPFDWWFEQDIPKINDNVIKFNFPGFTINHGLNYFNDIDFITLQRYIDKLYFKPKQYITDKINEIYDNEFKSEVVLGVMARGSEYKFYHACYGVKTIEDYINEIKQIMLLNSNITKIYVVSDETEWIDKFKNEFDNIYFLPDYFRRTDETDEYIKEIHYWMNVSDKREQHTKKLGEECIIQTKLLGKCDYLLGIHSGLLAGAILWSENIKELYLME